MRVWLLVALAVIIATTAQAQTKSRSTSSGVYSAEQAERGYDVYFGYCKSCHTPESHAGATFRATWNGRRLSELYAFIQERMPKNEPGSLSEREYVDVISYLLKMNKMPAGKTALNADSASLARIRIQFPKTIVRKEK